MTFSGCVGAGPAPGSLPGCAITASSCFNGKWQTISVPIPSTYTCTDLDVTKCWVRLQYSYPGQPTDTTSWSASIEGDPVRLVE